MTQEERVKEHLEKYNTITTFEAFRQYGITRLNNVIFLLRGKGMDIESVFKTTKNRYGDKVSYAEYTLHQREKTNERC